MCSNTTMIKSLRNDRQIISLSVINYSLGGRIPTRPSTERITLSQVVGTQLSTTPGRNSTTDNFQSSLKQVLGTQLSIARWSARPGAHPKF